MRNLKAAAAAIGLLALGALAGTALSSSAATKAVVLTPPADGTGVVYVCIRPNATDFAVYGRACAADATGVQDCADDALTLPLSNAQALNVTGAFLTRWKADKGY